MHTAWRGGWVEKKMFRNCSSQWFKHFDLVVKLKNRNFGFGIIERNTRVWDWHRHLTEAWNSDKHVGEDGLSCCADGEPTSASILCKPFKFWAWLISHLSNLNLEQWFDKIVYVDIYSNKISNLLISNSPVKMQ